MFNGTFLENGWSYQVLPSVPFILGNDLDLDKYEKNSSSDTGPAAPSGT